MSSTVKKVNSYGCVLYTIHEVNMIVFMKRLMMNL